MSKSNSRTLSVLKWCLAISVIALPVLLSALYAAYTAVPTSITIASGPVGGRYRQIAEQLGQEIEQRHGIEVKLLKTEGSGQNALEISKQRADLALYQRGTVALELRYHGIPISDIESMGGLFTEVVHWLKHPDHATSTMSQMRGLRVAIGPEHSGNELIGRFLLNHFDLTGDVELVHLPISDIRGAFLRGEIDAAFLTLGMQSPVLAELFETQPGEPPACVLAPIPFTEAMARHTIFLEEFTIPPGMYDQAGDGVPSLPVTTVATRAQLICHQQTPTRLVEMVTTILNDKSFQRQTGLVELMRLEDSFHHELSDFPLHLGAVHIYDPELKPLLNVEFVEATEGIRSFVVSLAIALFFLIKWINDRRTRSQEHKLDRYIRKLLKIEKEQKDLDQTDQTDDRSRLQTLLDQVTDLREQALTDFTAHDMNSDRAIECFVTMCHALSEKINAKISRQRFDAQLTQLKNSLSPKS